MESQLQQRDSSEEREFQRRESRRLRMRERRQNETDEERLRRINANRESMRRRRQEETQEETRTDQNRMSMTLRRRNLSASEYESQLEANRSSMRKRRRQGTVHRVALTNTIPEPFFIGTCTTVCEFCSARYFEKEKPRQNLTPCCSSGKINLPLRREPPDFVYKYAPKVPGVSQKYTDL